MERCGRAARSARCSSLRREHRVDEPGGDAAARRRTRQRHRRKGMWRRARSLDQRAAWWSSRRTESGSSAIKSVARDTDPSARWRPWPRAEIATRPSTCSASSTPSIRRQAEVRRAPELASRLNDPDPTTPDTASRCGYPASCAPLEPDVRRKRWIFPTAVRGSSSTM